MGVAPAMSPRRIAKLLTISGTVAVVAILIVTAWVIHQRSASRSIASTANMAGTLLHVHNFNWTQMRGDRSQWVLKAKDASYSNDKASIILVEPQLSMTTQDGKQLSVAASRAKLKVNRNHINQAELSGGLTVQYGDMVLATDRATLLPDDDEIRAAGSVRISGPGIDVAGIGLTGRPKAQFFQLLKHVTTEIEVKKARAKTS